MSEQARRSSPDDGARADQRRRVDAAERGVGVDDDLLADYVGGALADPDTEARVAELIAARTDWQAAHGAAVTADAAVRADLAQLGAATAAAPPELLAGLVEEFRRQGPAEPTVVGLDRARRRRRAGWLAGAAAAVLVLAFAGIAGASLFRGGSDRTASSDAGSAPRAAKSSPTLRPDHAEIGPNAHGRADEVGLAASGADYSTTTLSRVRGEAGQQALSGAAAARVPSSLRPLLGPARLDRCLHQLSLPSGYTASLVDFARFRNRPAAVVVASAGSSDRIAVVGPDCGTDGPHLRYQTSVISVHVS